MSDAKECLIFFRRTYPSANTMLVRSERPVLVDIGFSSDLPATEDLWWAAGVPPVSPALIVNTQYHCDHTGGNNGLH